MTPRATEKGRAAQQRGKKEVTFFDLLKQDHDKVQDMFEQIKEEEESGQDLFAELGSELQTHFQVEENFFYPALEQSEDVRQMALEAYEEHNVAKTVLNECNKLDPDDEHWKAKIKVLHEIVMHHIQEEEKEIFKAARKVLEKEQIQEITGQIQQQKSEIEKKAA